jgi:hypothetical protein
MKNKIISIICYSLLFGFAGGIVGVLFSKFYLFQDIYKIPLFGEINVPENLYGGSNLIIESPKKVIVEQNTKVLETINSAAKNMVGIFEKIPEKDISSTSDFAINKNYETKNHDGQGFIITSDGWIMSTFIPSELSLSKEKISTSTLARYREEFIDKYVIINTDGKVYDLTDFSYEDTKSISFWKIEAKDLSVKQFKKLPNINRGELVVAVNFKGDALLTTILKKSIDNPPTILSSENNYSEISLVDTPDKSFGDGFLLSTEGDLIALFSQDGPIKPVGSYLFCLSCVFEKNTLKRPYLGINYINLASFSSPVSGERYSQGALLYGEKDKPAIIKNSPAEKAGLFEGDIIISVNSQKINADNPLDNMLSELSPGDTLNLIVERDLKEISITATLGQQEID